MLPFDIFTPIISKILDFIPDPQKKAEAQAAAIKAAADHEEAILKILQAADLGQTEINKVEAASSNLFISGWRPFVGWVCASGFAWATVFQPILVFVLAAMNHSMVTPQIQTEILVQALFGLLGLGAMRSYEKKLGVQGNH